MPQHRPRPISAGELVARQRRVSQVARGCGFVGRVEYRHVYGQTGGAQYGLGVEPNRDLLTVSAEAFERDLNAEDFSLEAIIAHERGHQLLARHAELRRTLPGAWSGTSEEIVASLLGSLLVETAKDQEDLMFKAAFEATQQGMKYDRALTLMTQMRELLEKIL